MIKYPGGIVKNNNNVHNTKVPNKNKANLGLTFENLINETNLYYLKHNIDLDEYQLSYHVFL